MAEHKPYSTPGPKPAPKPAPKPVEASSRSETEMASLAPRMKAFKQYVQKYTACFSGSASSPSNLSTIGHEKVMLVIGASGALGAHLTYHIAQSFDVKRVVCLNRENKSERHKGLVNSVTHLIHNARPMSARRPLSGFESHFQVMRNPIDFACEAASRRPDGCKFGFQMASSIGVVGQYGFGINTKIIVPEDRVGIESVLPNEYGEAKWGCWWMLDLTLHQHPDRFRTMAVRLGQIAGSKTSSYWNPMEHFGFLVKSSQSLNTLPDMIDDIYWTPVNEIAGALSNLVLANNVAFPIHHIENPVGQPSREMTSILTEALHIPPSNVVPFQDWIEQVRNAPQKNTPASSLLKLLEDMFLPMACGGLVLDTKRTVEHPKTLRKVGPVSETVARKNIHIWRDIGFLSSTEEDKARFGDERARLWGHKYRKLGSNVEGAIHLTTDYQISGQLVREWIGESLICIR